MHPVSNTRAATTPFSWNVYYDLGEVHGDNAQLGRNRNRFEGDVDMSSGKTTYGDHTRVGGTHYDRKSNIVYVY